MAHSRATKGTEPPRSKRSPDIGNDLNRASWMNLDYFFPAALAEVRAEQALLGMPPKRGELRAFTFAGEHGANNRAVRRRYAFSMAVVL